MTTPLEDLKPFSHRLSEITLAAARTAVEDVLRFESPDRKWREFPGRPVVLGGDDITFIIRGDLALNFAWAYLGAFQRLGAERPELTRGMPVTACAGVAIVHAGFPFSHAHALAEELCQFAKSHLRETGPAADGPETSPGAKQKRLTSSGLAFHRVTSPMTGSWKEGIIEDELTVFQNKTPHRLTMSPYTLDPVDGRPLLRDLSELTELFLSEGFPVGLLREAVGLMATDPERGRQRLQRIEHVQLSRDDASVKRWQRLADGLYHLGCDRSGWSAAGNNGQPLATPLLDAISWWHARTYSQKEDSGS